MAVDREEAIPELGSPPAGWVEAKLGQIAEVIGGGTPKASDPVNFSSKGIPWITPADLSGFQGKRIARGERSLSHEGFDSCSSKMLPSGAVLMSSRAPIGYLAIAANPLCTNQGFKSFICGPSITPDYLFYWLRFINAQLQEMGSGSTFAEISGSRAKEIPVLVAPLEEQPLLVAQIEALVARVNAARVRLEKVPTILKRFRQAVVAAACSGGITETWRKDRTRGTIRTKTEAVGGATRSEPVPGFDEEAVETPEIPGSWNWVRCEELCDPERATTYGVIKLGQEVPDGIPTLRSSDVRWLRLEADHVKRISPNIAKEYSRTFLKGGEVLVTVRGTLGGVAVVPPSMAGFNISREVAMLPLLPGTQPGYVCLAVASGFSQSWLSEVTKGVAYSGVNIRDLKRLPIPMPPQDEQQEIVRRVEALLRLADGVEEHVTASTARTDRLTQAILAKAFRGELTDIEVTSSE